MNAIVYRAVKMFLKNFHNRQLAVALLPDVDWIIKSVRAILVARSTVRGSGMCPSQSNEQTCRSLTQNMLCVHVLRSRAELDGIYISTKTSTVCYIPDYDFEIFQISKCQERASSNAFLIMSLQPLPHSPDR